jgi:hypothetical protein
MVCIRPVKEFETLNYQVMKYLNRIKTLRKLLKPLLILCGVMPRIKIWKENDGHTGVNFYWNDNVMRELTKKWYTLHIEFTNVKVCIFSKYGA